MRPCLAGIEHGDGAGAGWPFAPFERKVGQLRPHLGQGPRRFQAELGLRVDGAAQGGDALGDRAGVFEQVLGEHAAIIAAGEKASPAAVDRPASARR